MQSRRFTKKKMKDKLMFVGTHRNQKHVFLDIDSCITDT